VTVGGHGALIIDWLDSAPSTRCPSTSSPTASSPSCDAPGRPSGFDQLARAQSRKFWARAPADALGVKQEFEKALAQDGKPAK
jgi:hypothetical protein